jgi:hypothetical protein
MQDVSLIAGVEHVLEPYDKLVTVVWKGWYDTYFHK